MTVQNLFDGRDPPIVITSQGAYNPANSNPARTDGYAASDDQVLIL